MNRSAPKRATKSAGGAGTPSGAGSRIALTNMYWPMTHGFRRSSRTHSLPPMATSPNAISAAASGLSVRAAAGDGEQDREDGEHDGGHDHPPGGALGDGIAGGDARAEDGRQQAEEAAVLRAEDLGHRDAGPAAAPRYQTSDNGMATAIGSTQRQAASRAMRPLSAASGSHAAVQMA